MVSKPYTGIVILVVVIAIVILVLTVSHSLNPPPSPSRPYTNATSPAVASNITPTKAKTHCYNFTIVEGAIYRNSRRLILTVKNRNPVQVIVRGIYVVELDKGFNVSTILNPGAVKTYTYRLNQANIPMDRVTVKVYYICSGKNYTVTRRITVMSGP